MNPGDIFRINDPSVPDYPWIVLAIDSSDTILVAPIMQTQHKSFDDACVIRAGEHSTIWRKSFVNYQLARTLSAQTQSMIAKALLAQGAVSDVVLNRAQQGGFKSPHAYIRHQDFLRASGISEVS